MINGKEREKLKRICESLDDDRVYMAEEVGELFGRKGQTVRSHARRHNIGENVGPRYKVYRKSDIEKLVDHFSQIGNPTQGLIYNDWGYDRFLKFVHLNERTEEGYTYTAETLAKELDTTPVAINGLRRKYKLAKRILVANNKEVSEETIAHLIQNRSESSLRKEGRRYPALD